ncbi:MAG TPA: TetR/AcrR family transcriptional regulator [Acidimicrobiia bacterium]
MLTTKGSATRSRIIEGAAAEIREHGIGATTLDDVLARTRTSKGQLFHYFPQGKEELLLAVAAHEADRVLADQQPHLGDLTSRDAWHAWRDAVVDRYRRQGPRCPLAVLTAEIGRATPGTQAVVTSLVQQWERQVIDGIVAMQASGDFDVEVDPTRAGMALVAGIQGGVAIMLATGDLGHLEAALDTGIAHLARRA